MCVEDETLIFERMVLHKSLQQNVSINKDLNHSIILQKLS